LPLPGFLKFEGKLFDVRLDGTFDFRLCGAVARAAFGGGALPWSLLGLKQMLIGAGCTSAKCRT
jgi:hypothetical protein